MGLVIFLRAYFYGIDSSVLS